ncbi:hypothetical protein B0H14DRAFT_2600459 [Mycena olivaceomarginata]|nr:hypothetical protein B0H14DRAFT_2600459 [Mycena olivaceomarginata]
MSTPSQTTSSFVPFVFFNTPADPSVGAEAFFENPEAFDSNLPPYRLTATDVLPSPGHPLLSVYPTECRPSTTQTSTQSWPPFYFFAHPAIYRLLPFIQVLARIACTDPQYLATILDCTVPETVHRAHALIPHSRAQMVFMASLLRMVTAVARVIPKRVRGGWSAFFPPNEPADSPTWETFPFVHVAWLFPGTEEFPEDHPLCNPLSIEDHSTLLCIARPSLRIFIPFLARGCVRETGERNLAINYLNEALDPQYPVFEMFADELRTRRLSPEIVHGFFNSIHALIAALPSELRNPAWTNSLLPADPGLTDRHLAPSFAIPCCPHEDLLTEPYPILDMSDYDSFWHGWQQIQAHHQFNNTMGTQDRAGTYSPQYRPSTPPSVFSMPNPSMPPTYTGPSAAGSTSFDIRTLRSSVQTSPSLPRGFSAIAASPTDSSEMQVDEPVAPPEDAVAIAEASEDQAEPAPRRGPLRSSRQSVASTPSRPSHSQARKTRPLIELKTSQKSVTPPASEAFNEEGEDELDNKEEVPRPTKRQRSSCHAATGQAQGKGKGKGKACAPTPTTPSTSSRFPLVVRKTRGKSKKAELPSYVPLHPVPTMDTVRLAAESLAKEQHEPTVFDAGCSNCIFHNRDCEHGKPGVLCDHCKKGRLSHCTHTFTVPEHVQAANHIEPGNELLDLSAARIDYELARESLFHASSHLVVTSNRVGAWIREVTASLGADGLPRMDEIPAELQPLWAQLTIDYRTAIMQYPFLSDTCHTESTSDDELQQLLNILARRATRNQQSTPPPAEDSSWPEEDEAGPSGSK